MSSAVGPLQDAGVRMQAVGDRMKAMGRRMRESVTVEVERMARKRRYHTYAEAKAYADRLGGFVVRDRLWAVTTPKQKPHPDRGDHKQRDAAGRDD